MGLKYIPGSEINCLFLAFQCYKLSSSRVRLLTVMLLIESARSSPYRKRISRIHCFSSIVFSFFFLWGHSSGINPLRLDNQFDDRWSRFDSWTCNTPQVNLYGRAEFFASGEEEHLDRILLFGGQIWPESLGYDTAVNETWIYYEETNSWRIVENLSETPPGLVNPSLVTFCNSYVLLIHPSFINSSWVFRLDSKQWKRVYFEGDTNVNLQPYRFVAIAVHVTDSHRSWCGETVLVFPCGFGINDWSTFHQLVMGNNTNTYTWKRISLASGVHPVATTCSSVVTSVSKDTVFAIAESCLWYFSVRTSKWTSTTSCSRQGTVFTAASIFERRTYNTKSIYVFFSSIDRVVLRLIRDEPPALSERILGFSPDFANIYSIRAFSETQIVVYAKENYKSCGTSKYMLQRDNDTRVWFWTKLVTTRTTPSYGISAIYAKWRDNLYLLEYYGSPETRNTLLWSLDLRKMQWAVLDRFKDSELTYAYAWKSRNTWLDDNTWLIVRSHDTFVITPAKQIHQIQNPKPSSRVGFSLVTMNCTSALLFGGKTKSSVLNDLWLFSSIQDKWTRLQPDSSIALVPSPRYGHAAGIIRSDMFIYGGCNYNCYEEMWKFNLLKNVWSIVEAKNYGPRLASVQPCFSSAVAQAGHLWIALRCNQSFVTDTYRGVGIQIWLFIPHLRMWEPVSPVRHVVHMETLNFPDYSLVYWRGYLLTLPNTPNALLLYTKVRCPGGFASRNISEVTCDICDFGSYTDLTAENCLRCPSGTTTSGQRSTSINDCNICVMDYCQNGQCLVVSKNSTQSPVCHCHFGFTGSHCQYATYYYIGSGVTLFIVAMLLTLTIIFYLKRKRKLERKALHQEIEQLYQVWQIDWEELITMEQIGSGASGMVWLARYRDLMVAVKILRVSDDPQMSLEFAREIKFMQTMRHPNIVLFLGAGRTNPQGQPFLVVEFTRHGSLRKVLDRDSIQLDIRRKILFALDAAKGMAFLHNLDPPRIHRDLKSDNLLVSENWVVKIADFGLGRPFHSDDKILEPPQGKKTSLRRSHNQGSETVPLLERREGLSLHGIGTARWRAPELSRNEKYNGSVDAYRYVYGLIIGLG